MKKIGLLGGMSWESTAEYYRIINQETGKKLGGLHSAECIIGSVNFAEIAKLQHDNQWPQAADILVKQAIQIEHGGADFLLICTNTMHKIADEISAGITIPLLHIGDATAAYIQANRLSRVALLGTKFTMEEKFYKNRLIENYDISVLTPSESDRELIHHVIFYELCLGKIKESSKNAFISIIEKLIADGAEGIILGCTEIPLLIKPEDIEIPLIDTTLIHAKAAVELALKNWSKIDLS